LSPWLNLLLGACLLPFYEELLFRLSLRFKPGYLAVSSACVSFLLLTKAVFQTRISSMDSSFPLRVGVSLLVLGLVWWWVRNPRVQSRLKDFWQEHVHWIYYLSFLSFAVLHIFNYELTWVNLMLLPIITLPQLLSGIVNGFLRVRYGFHYPLVAHMLTNGLFISLGILLGEG